MIIINFSHPLTPGQLAQIEALTGQQVGQVISVPVAFDHQHPFAGQVRAMLDGLPLLPEELQTESLLVNLPSLNYIAAVLLAELHGRMGYFPACLRMRPVEGSLPPRFEVAEILNLQAIRDEARRKR